MEDHLCDVVLKSQDGTEHRAHRNVLSAASSVLKALLSGAFQEGERIGAGEPVDLAASAGAVAGMLDYLYGGEPTVTPSDAVELLRMADAYGLRHLAAALEEELVASLDDASALQFLKQSATLVTPKLHDACEDHVASCFQTCVQHPTFLDLCASQIARLLKREDLNVSREEVVLQGLWTWLRVSNDRLVNLGPLLQLVDFQSLAKCNLETTRLLAQSMGAGGFDLQKEADSAIRKRLTFSDSSAVRPKRRRLNHWSPELGAHSGEMQIHLKDQLKGPLNFCLHEGSIYIADSGNCRILRWTPGTDQVQVVAGQGASVNGVNDLGDELHVAVSPVGEIVVGDWKNGRLVSFENGVGKVLLETESVGFFSPNGVLYILDQDGTRVQRLDGAVWRPVLVSDDLPEEQQFAPGLVSDFAVSTDEVIFLPAGRRVLRYRPGDSEAAIVGCAPINGCSVLEVLTLWGDTIYAVDSNLQKIWSFQADGSDGKVAVDFVALDSNADKDPSDVLVHEGSLYVLHQSGGYVTQHVLPARITLEPWPQEAGSS